MKVTSNVKYIPAGVTQYIVDGNDGEINVDTSVSAVTIILPNIINSGYTNTDKGFIINDFSGNAGTNNITLVASNNTVNSQSSVLISVNGGTAKCSIASMNEWFVITEPSTSGMSGTLTANYIPKAATSSTLTNSIIYQDGHNIAIGTTTAVAKLHVLQNTVGTGAKAFSVNFATIGETFYLDDNGYAYYYGGGFTVAGSNAILNLVSNGGVSPSIKFKYNNGASTSGFLYGVGASMFFETPAFGLGSSYFNPQARFHVQGVNSTSANFALKVDNSASSSLFYVRNDGVSTFTSAFDGVTAGNANYAYETTLGGLLVSYNAQANTAFNFYKNSLLRATIINNDGYFSISPKYRMSLKTLDDNKSHIWFDSDGLVGVGNDYFSSTAQLHVKGIDATSSNYALKVDNSASSPLLYVRNDGNIGVFTNTPVTRLDVNGDFSMRSATSATAITGNTNNFSTTSTSFIILSNNTGVNYNLTGFADGFNGKRLVVTNLGIDNIVLTHEDAASSAANRIITGKVGGSNILQTNDTCELIYDIINLRWRLINHNA